MEKIDDAEQMKRRKKIIVAIGQKKARESTCFV
jgi:hypothetical protein